MEIGMLWYDGDAHRALGDKVGRAVEHYKTKYGAVPTVCYINPATFKDGPEMAAGVQLRTARNVLVDHFWIGVGENQAGNGRDSGRGNGKNGNGHTNGNGRRKK